MNKYDNYAEVKEENKLIYHKNKYRFSYKIITLELKNIGHTINYKTVLKLTKECKIKCKVIIRNTILTKKKMKLIDQMNSGQ